LDETPTKAKSKRKKQGSKPYISDESDAYIVSVASSSESEPAEFSATPQRELDVQDNSAQPRRPSSLFVPNGSFSLNRISAARPIESICGLCGSAHSGPCYMTDSSENLAEYRRMLIFDAVDEPFEERVWFLRLICDFFVANAESRVSSRPSE